LRRRLPIVLRRAWYGLNQAFRRQIAHTGLTPDQFTALRTLWERGRAGLTQCELAERMSSDPNTITALLRRMEQAGLVERTSDPRDRRAHRVRLLPLGRRRHAQLRRQAEALQDGMLAVLPAAGRVRFLEQLARVADACHAAAASSGETIRHLRPVASKKGRAAGAWRVAFPDAARAGARPE
jgi:DNA-binding MarR family transcriptional regulator